MGRAKGLLDLEGRPIVMWVVERLGGIVDELAVSTSPANHEAYRRTLPEDIACIPDEIPLRGPMGGWTSGLPAVQGEYVVISPCDTPFYLPALGRLLIDRATGHDGAVPVIGRRFEPLHGVYRRERLRDAVERCLAEGRTRPIHTYKYLDIVQVAESEVRSIDSDLQTFMNANTPDEYERLRARARNPPGGT